MTDLRDDSTIARLRTSLGGTLLTPDTVGYDAARVVFNAMIDRHPSLIAQCTDTADVVTALNHARNAGLEVAVRGGGHSVAGSSSTDGGLVIDLRHLNHVRVDPQTRTAEVGGGATMADLDAACQPYHLATTGGRVSTTGVGGFTLGGGTGWLDRKFGLACDNLVAAELVTAAGEVVHTSANEHPELFWALHGGGGNFGVVTSLTLALHELPETTLALLLWSPEHGPAVVRAFRDLMQTAPDDLGGAAIYLTGTADEFVPSHLVERLCFAVVLIYAGSAADLRELAAPLFGLGPEGTMVEPMPYADIQRALDDPPGQRNYWSAEHLDALPDDAIDAFCAAVDDMITSSASQHVLFPMGGATARAEVDDPIPWRTAPWVVHPFGLWTDAGDDERGIQWTRNVRAAMRPWATGDVYLNFIGDEGHDRVAAGFGQHYQRLAAVKATYDPDNVFRLNHNIIPAPSPV